MAAIGGTCGGATGSGAGTGIGAGAGTEMEDIVVIVGVGSGAFFAGLEKAENKEKPALEGVAAGVLGGATGIVG